MSKKKKENKVNTNEPTTPNKELISTEEFVSKTLEIESPVPEDIVNLYNFIENGRFFKDGKEFIVITLTSHNI